MNDTIEKAHSRIERALYGLTSSERAGLDASEARNILTNLWPSIERELLASRNIEKRRASWDEYFMRIAEEIASRGTCDRKRVGAMIVRDKSILATGYNGSIRGLKHCDEDGHLMEDGHCVRTIHAEANAIVQAARNGAHVDGGTMYVTASPCWGCFKMIANAGIARIVFGEFYRDERIFQFATEIGIKLVLLEAPAQAQDTSKRNSVTVTA